METLEGLVVQETKLPTNFYELTANNKIAFATSIAKELTKIIDTQKMYSVINGKKFVTCEGWTTTLALLGIVPKERSIVRLQDGGYEAHVDLVRFDNGQVVGGASSLCGMDEKSWASRPEFARRSMACTRATGKAARLAYSWIVQLAGYEPSVAEEMPEGDRKEYYVASSDQMKEFAKLCAEFKITDKSTMKSLSDKFKGKVHLENIRGALSQAIPEMTTQ